MGLESLIGLGRTANDMYGQFLYVLERTGLPIDKEAARTLFEQHDKAHIVSVD